MRVPLGYRAIIAHLPSVSKRNNCYRESALMTSAQTAFPERLFVEMRIGDYASADSENRYCRSPFHQIKPSTDDLLGVRSNRCVPDC